MANVKISALPSYTGTAADLRWFVMNNSGETETFKYSGYTSPFKTGSVNNSATLIGYAGTNAGRAGVLAGGSSTSYANTANSIVWGEQCWVGDDQQYPSAVFGRFCRSTGSGNLVAGNNSAAAGVYSIVIGEGNSCDTIWGSVFGRSCSIDGASYMSIVAGNISSIQNSYAAAVFGEQNGINGSQYSSILGGKQNTINATSPYNSIVGGQSNLITLSSTYSSIGGGQNNTITDAGYGFIGGGRYNILSGGTNYSSIVGGLSNENYGNYSGIFNGTLNKINNPLTEHASIIGAYSSSTEGDYSHIIGGLYNQIFNQQAVIVGGQYNIINAGASQAEIIGSRNCIINGTTVDNTIINSIDSVIPNGIDRAVMLGTSGRTADADNTTFVENLASFGQSYQGYFDNGSGSTFTINWNNGNTQKMSFTGAGGITCNNTQTGAHYRMVINNPNGYTPTSFTAAGRTIKFNGGSFVVYSGESICELFITNDSVFVNQLGLFS